MTTKTINSLLKQYKEIDLQFSALSKEKESLKKRIEKILEKNDESNYSYSEFKVSRYSTTREMFIKKSLEKFVDEKILNKCKKVISYEQTRISYGKK